MLCKYNRNHTTDVTYPRSFNFLGSLIKNLKILLLKKLVKVLNINDKNFFGVRNFLICSGNFFLKIKNKIIGSIIALKGVKTVTSGAIYIL